MSDTAIITITDNAAKKIKEFSEGAPESMGLRLSVIGSGCSGLAYKMGLEDAPVDNTKIKTYTINGIRVFIDKKSSLYLIGTTIDYIDGLMASGFKMTNENVKKTCGCGNSFSV